MRCKKEVFASPEFLAIWDKIKHKTLYRVRMDTEKFVDEAVRVLKNMPAIQSARIAASTAAYDIEKTGVTYEEVHTRVVELAKQTLDLPNLLYSLQDNLQLDLKTVKRIIAESGKIQDFTHNPERFVEQVTEILRGAKNAMLADGVRYKKIAGKEFYAQEIFDKEELIAYTDDNAIFVEHSVYDHVITDSSQVERDFARALDKDQDVKLFFKLPDKFKIDTPLGTYNPDWAILVDVNGTEKLYFVIETKGSRNLFDLRGREKSKIDYAREHFKALDDVGFDMTNDWRKWKTSVKNL